MMLSAATKVEPIVTESNKALPSNTNTQPAAQDGDSSVDKDTSSKTPEKNNSEQKTTSNSEKTPAKKSPPPSETGKPPAQKKGSGLAIIALIFSLIAIIIALLTAGYFWQKEDQQSQQISHLRTQSSEQSQQMSALRSDLQQQSQYVNTLLNEQKNALGNLSKQTYSNSQKLSDLGARSRSDWLLAEAEYLMRLANQRLNLEKDVNSAEAMLSSADKILAEIDDPGLFDIRKTLANEITSLQQLRHLDIQGIYFKLAALIDSIQAIKQQNLRNFEAPQPESTALVSDTDANGTSDKLLQLWNTIWQDLKQAVSIRRLDEPLPPLLAPEQHYYLKQNLRMMLEQASLGLLDGRTDIYQSSLQKASTWLSDYFITEDPSIQQIQKTISQLSSQEITQSLPDISHSLRLTKAKIESFYRQHTLNKLSSPDTETSSDANSEGALP